MRLVLLGEAGPTDGRTADAVDAAASALVERLGADVSVLGADRGGVGGAGRTGGPLGFGGLATVEQRESRLEAVLAAAAGDGTRLAWDDAAWPAVQALVGADAVVLVGEEDADPADPTHAYERAAVAAVATARGLPLVVTGLAVGPFATERLEELTSGALRSAVLVGVADSGSLARCRSLGVPAELLMTTVDAATGPSMGRVARWTPPAPEYLAASLSREPGLLGEQELVAALGRLLAHARAVSGLDVVLVRDEGDRTVATPTDEAVLHDALRSAAGTTGVHLAPLDAASHAAALRGAAAVLTTRPSAAVVALGAATPTLAVSDARRTGRRMSSAMEMMGLGPFVLPAPALLTDGPLRAFEELWARREPIRDGLERLAGTRLAEVEAWWDAAAAALLGDRPAAAPERAVAPQVSAGSWSVHAADLRAWADALDADLFALSSAAEVATAAADAAVARQVALEHELATLRTALDDAAAELSGMRESVRAAHELTEEHLAAVVRAAREVPTVAAVQRELDALRGTRTFRYLAGPRRIWSRVRSRRSR